MRQRWISLAFFTPWVFLMLHFVDVFCSDHIDIVSYGLTPPVILSTIPLLRPGYDLGVEHLKSTYGFNVTITYLSSPLAKTCADLPDHLDLVYEYYYRKHASDDSFALILPGCDDLVPLGKIAREWNVPLLSCGPTSDLRDRKNYPTSINNGPMQMSMLAEVFLRLFDRFSWFSVALLVDMGSPAPFFRMWTEALKGQLLGKMNTKIVIQRQTFDSKADVDYRAILSEASKVSRVIVISSFPRTVRNFMIEAHRSGRTNGEYVYLSLEPFQNQRYFGNLTWQNFDSFDEIAREAFRSLKQVSPCYDDLDDASSSVQNQLVNKLVHLSQTVYNYTYRPGELPNPFLFAAYESMELFGTVLNESSNYTALLRDGRRFVSDMVNRTLDLPTGMVSIGQYGEKRADYCMNSLNPATFLYEAVVKYRESDGNFLTLNYSIDWANALRRPPSNEPRCGYLGGKTVCFKTIWTDYLSTIVAVLLVGLLVIGLLGWKIIRTSQVGADVSKVWWHLLTDDCANFMAPRRRSFFSYDRI